MGLYDIDICATFSMAVNGFLIPLYVEFSSGFKNISWMLPGQVCKCAAIYILFVQPYKCIKMLIST